MSASAKFFLFLILFFLACFLSAVFFLKKLEAKREEITFSTCQAVIQEKEKINQLLASDQGYQTFKNDDFFTFKKQWEERSTAYQDQARILDEIPPSLANLTNQCQEALISNGKLIRGAKERLEYLTTLKEAYDFFQEKKQQLEEKGFKGLEEVGIEKERLRARDWEEKLETLKPPATEWQILDEDFKKTSRGLVELWHNSQVAWQRRTPVIFTSSFWVFKEDCQQLKIDLEKIEVLL